MLHKDPVIIRPNISTMAEGFPNLEGFEIYVVALGDDSTPTKTITLQFSRCNADRSVLEEIQVYLLNSEYGPADFEAKESLPHLLGYRIEQTQDRHAKDLLVLDCDTGSLAFTFEKAFHTTSSYKTK